MKKKPSRRTILKLSGTTLGGFGAISNAATVRGQESDRSQEETIECNHCREIVEDTEEYQISIVTNEGGAYLLYSNKERRSVTILDQAETADELNTEQNAIEANTVRRASAQRPPIIESAEFNSYRMGSCNGYIYNTHRGGVLTIETGSNLDGVPEVALSAAICGIPGLAGGLATGFLAGVGCAVGWQIFFGHINLIDADISIGAWDDHVGWLGEEAIMTGAVNGLTTHHSNLIKGDHYKGLHIGAADDSQDVINEVISRV